MFHTQWTCLSVSLGRTEHVWAGWRKGEMHNTFARLSEARVKVRLFALRCPLALGSCLGSFIKCVALMRFLCLCSHCHINLDLALATGKIEPLGYQGERLFFQVWRWELFERNHLHFQILMCQRPCYQTACCASCKLHSFCLRLCWRLPFYAITHCPYSSPVLFLFFFPLLEVLVQISLHTWQNNLESKETELLVELSVLKITLVPHPFLVNMILSAFRVHRTQNAWLR